MHCSPYTALPWGLLLILMTLYFMLYFSLFLFYHPMSIIEVILYLQCISILAAPFCTFAYLKCFCVCTVFLCLQCFLIFEAFLCLHCIYVFGAHLFIWSVFVYLRHVCVSEERFCLFIPHFCICSTFAPVGHCTIALLFSSTLICILINWGEYSQICSMKLHSSLVNVLCIHILVIYNICQVVVYSIFHPCMFIQSVEISDIRKQTSRQ